MSNSRKKSVFVIAVLMMIAVTLTLVSSTYARYTATISRNGTATVAKWAFTADNSGSTTMNVSFADTYHASTLVAGKIAPGTKGSFDISVSNASSEVGVEYTVTLGTIANAPTNIKFYSDATYATPLTTSTPITGKIKANDPTAKSLRFIGLGHTKLVQLLQQQELQQVMMFIRYYKLVLMVEQNKY